jgi:hypothetical protein
LVFLEALETSLAKQGFESRASGAKAAERVYCGPLPNPPRGSDLRNDGFAHIENILRTSDRSIELNSKYFFIN